MGKAQYKTKQMSEISVPQQMEGTHVTVADICDYFKKKRNCSRYDNGLSSVRQNGQ